MTAQYQVFRPWHSLRRPLRSSKEALPTKAQAKKEGFASLGLEWGEHVE